MNLQAAKKAKASTAYDPALQYLETGLRLLASNSWDNQYKLTWELHIKTLELLYLNTKFEQFEELSETILQQAKEILDQAKVNQLQISYYYTTFQASKAIDIAIKILRKLGTNISQEHSNIENKIEQQQDLIRLLLQGKEIEYLYQLPVMTDKYHITVIQILQQIISATHTTNFLYLLR